MAYASDKAPLDLTALTSLAAGDGIVVGDADDATEKAKYITLANLETQLNTDLSFQAILAEGAFVDGDKTKLDGIEASATADQTGAEIKTAYEAEANTNAFTDAEKTLLGNQSGTNTGDEDTASITALGALMDSEVTNLAQVKAFDSSDYATAAQGSTADAALPKAGGTMTGDIQLGETDIKLDATLSADEKWSGIVVAGTAGATLAVGDVCYLASTGKWLLNDGILDGTDTGFDKQLGICVLASTDTNPTEILLYGKIRSAAFPVFTVGSPVYLSDTAGDLVVTQPSTTNFAIRKVGHALSAEELMFNPSNDYIVHV